MRSPGWYFSCTCVPLLWLYVQCSISLYLVKNNTFNLLMVDVFTNFFHQFFSVWAVEKENNGILLPKLLEKIVLVIEKNFWNLRLKAEKIEISRTIYSNTERSEQFLKQNSFLTCTWRFLRSNTYFRTIRIQIGKKYWDLETCRKS